MSTIYPYFCRRPLDNIGVDSIMGIDILPEAKKATFRDRPEIYDDYLVTNLADMPKKHKIKLEGEHFNTDFRRALTVILG